MLAQEIISKKRDGLELSGQEISGFISALTEGAVGDAQAGAFAMAVLLNGMSAQERVSLTEAMRDSGDVLSWDLPGPVLDKHSTGGIGDNVSLVLAPALAVCGAYVPMISGRGLGHTGGTLDKLDAIPGYRTTPESKRIEQVTKTVGCAIVGQTSDIAPADKRLYAIRDVTGTVSSIDLICASILSKKLAAGLDGLVLDVKVGSGAFMTEPKEAKKLAETLVEVSNGAGCRTKALITDMNEPLASTAGNALEVANAMQLLRGDEIDSRLWDVVVALGGELLVLGGLSDAGSAKSKIADALQSGAAAERFGQMASALGGPADIVENFEAHLDQAPVIQEVLPEKDGFVQEIDTRSLGLAVVELGGGRTDPKDDIDHAVGLDWISGLHQSVDRDTPLCRIHARRESDAALAESRIKKAFKIGKRPKPENDLILETVG